MLQDILNIKISTVYGNYFRKQKTDIDFAEKNQYVQSFSIKVMIRKDFHSIFCKICSKEYSPEEIIYETWSRGESLFASGGKTLLCENNHFLFGYMEWNS